MYALVEIQGKQYKAEEGRFIQVDKIDAEVGAKLEFTAVMMVSNGDVVKFGAPYVGGAKITATLEDQIKGDKVRVFKFKRRKGYRRTQGHRQQYSIVRINSIEA